MYCSSKNSCNIVSVAAPDVLTGDAHQRAHPVASPPDNRNKGRNTCLGLIWARGFSLQLRLAGFRYRFLSMLAVLGLEQVSNVMSHVICQHGRMSGLRTLQCKACRAVTGVHNWVNTRALR